MSDLVLTDEQLVEVTRKHRPSAQCRALRKMGIEHRQRPDGTVLVHRQHYDNLLGVVANAKVTREKRFEINWED